MNITLDKPLFETLRRNKISFLSGYANDEKELSVRACIETEDENENECEPLLTLSTFTHDRPYYFLGKNTMLYKQRKLENFLWDLHFRVSWPWEGMLIQIRDKVEILDGSVDSFLGVFLEDNRIVVRGEGGVLGSMALYPDIPDNIKGELGLSSIKMVVKHDEGKWSVKMMNWIETVGGDPTLFGDSIVVELDKVIQPDKLLSFYLGIRTTDESCSAVRFNEIKYQQYK